MKTKRTHRPHWRDNTRNERQKNRRNDIINEKFRAAGWTGFSEYLTAVLNGDIQPPQKPKERE